MSLYYAIFFIIAFASFLEAFGLKKDDTLKLYITICIGLFTMSFLRWETGTDWGNYYNYFIATPPELFPDSPFEIGYAFLSGLAKIISSEYTILLLLNAIVLFSFQSVGLWKLSPLPIFSILFFWGINYGGVFFVRQTVAGAMLLFSVIYIRDKKFLPFLICVIIAMLFHRTSIFFVLAYWIFKLKWNLYVMGFILIISIGFTAVADVVMQSLGALVGGVIQMKIEAYTGELRGEDFGLTQSLPVIIAKAFFSKFLLIIGSMIMLARIESKAPEFRGYLNLYWFGAVIFMMTISISPGLARLAYSFDMLQIILLPYIIKAISDKNLRIFVVIISFCYIALRLYTVTTGGYYDEFVPYKTFFGK